VSTNSVTVGVWKDKKKEGRCRCNLEDIQWKRGKKLDAEKFSELV